MLRTITVFLISNLFPVLSLLPAHAAYAANPATPDAAVSAAAPDALVKDLTVRIFDRIKSDPEIKAGNPARINALIDEELTPHTDFERTTRATIGKYWRQATPEQQQQLVTEFRNLLVRVYAGATRHAGDQKFEFRPLRAEPGATQVVVQTYVINRGEKVQVDYRMIKTAAGWKVYDVNVLGLWLTEAYRNQFQPVLANSGIPGLLTALRQQNQQLADRDKSS